MHFKLACIVLSLFFYFEGQSIDWFDRNYWNEPIPCEQRFESGFTKFSNLNYCERFFDNYFVIFITSAPNNFPNREFIRETWGRFNKKRKVPVLFFIGLSDNKDTKQKIAREQIQHNDLIQGKFYDSYQNLTFKTIAMLEYTVKYCSTPSYILKCDDDVLVNIINLDHFLTTLRPRTYLVGTLLRKTKPIRDLSSKYYTTFLEYDRPSYPSYLNGHAYLISTTVARRIYKAALKHNCFWLEDVYITGLIPEKIKISRRNYNKFILNTFDYAYRFYNITNTYVLPKSDFQYTHDFICVHGKNIEYNRNLWKNYKKSHYYDKRTELIFNYPS